MYCIPNWLKSIKLFSFYLYSGILVFIGSCDPVLKEDPRYRQEIAALRMQLNEAFFDRAQSPLDSARFQSFKGLKFFPVQESYRVTAKLTRIENQEIFDLPHTHARSKPYKNYAVAQFEWHGQSVSFKILEPQIKKPGYENYLLLAFTDESNGKETYGGGRYIDLEKTDGNEVILDFNKAYNPYCAYGSGFTCPIPPKENNLTVPVEAGMKYDPKELGH